LAQYSKTLTRHSLEFAGLKIDVSDVDEASASLQDLQLLDIQDSTHDTRRIADTHLLHLGADDQPTISDVYDSILQSWIATLPRDAPLRIRQHKERLARRIAAEVILAGTRLLQREVQPNNEKAQPGISQDSAISVPILSSQPLDSSQTSLPSPQTLPTPPLSRSETQPPSSQSSAFLSSQNNLSQQPSLSKAYPLADPLTRLGKHLKFNEDSASQLSIPESVDQLLRHWQPGVDPRTYDWNATELANRVDVIDETSQQQLEKARKRKERQERKQRREDELAQAQPSSQPFVFTRPAGYPRSSPGPMLGGADSSSQAPSQRFPQVPLPGTGFHSQSQGAFGPFVAQSQVEPGKFGGRPDKKKKRKGRVSGF
jgi:RNA polymerase I-specific transcription initiation factor RRN6